MKTMPVRTSTGKPRRPTGRRGGWLLIETLVAIIILGMLLGGFAVLQNRMKTFNAYQFARQRCIAAASAQLESLSATGEPMTEEDIKRLWPGVTVTVEQSAGVGDWKGTTLAKAAAVVSVGGREVKVALSRYVIGKGKLP